MVHSKAILNFLVSINAFTELLAVKCSPAERIVEDLRTSHDFARPDLDVTSNVSSPSSSPGRMRRLLSGRSSPSKSKNGSGDKKHSLSLSSLSRSLSRSSSRSSTKSSDPKRSKPHSLLDEAIASHHTIIKKGISLFHDVGYYKILSLQTAAKISRIGNPVAVMYPFWFWDDNEDDDNDDKDSTNRLDEAKGEEENARDEGAKENEKPVYNAKDEARLSPSLLDLLHYNRLLKMVHQQYEILRDYRHRVEIHAELMTDSHEFKKAKETDGLLDAFDLARAWNLDHPHDKDARSILNLEEVKLPDRASKEVREYTRQAEQIRVELASMLAYGHIT